MNKPYLNRINQRRFQKRHPNYQRVKAARRAERVPPPPPPIKLSGYRTFELCDPRDESKLPLYVSVCAVETNPVWERLWSVRYYSRSRLAEWMHELDTQGLTPEERPSQLNIGLSFGVPWTVAIEVARRRQRRINQLVTGDINTLPSWSLQPMNSSIAYVTLSGVVCRYKSAHKASRVKKTFTPAPLTATIIQRATLVFLDKAGRTWFYD